MTRTSVILALGGLACGAFFVAAPLFLKPYGIFILSMWAVMSIAALGLNLTLGFAGQVSLAQGAFVGIGAYAAALLTTHGWPLGYAMMLGAVLCFVFGWVLGYPALRVQSHYLAFVTLAFTTLAFLVFRNEDWLTGGTRGIFGIQRPVIFGWSTKPAASYYYFCLIMLLLFSFVAWWIIRSPWGRAFTAVRENPIRALSLGINTRLYILIAFAIGAGFGGVSGALYAPLVQYIDATPFTLILSLNLLLMVVVGGSGYFAGPFIGAVVVTLLPEWLRAAEGFYLIGYGTLVLVLMMFCPSGLLGLVEKVFPSSMARGK
jgi:branched-chain amino acid transport system permease protein